MRVFHISQVPAVAFHNEINPPRPTSSDLPASLMGSNSPTWKFALPCPPSQLLWFCTPLSFKVLGSSTHHRQVGLKGSQDKLSKWAIFLPRFPAARRNGTHHLPPAQTLAREAIIRKVSQGQMHPS